MTNILTTKSSVQTIGAVLFCLMASLTNAQEEKTLFGEDRWKSSGGWGGYRAQWSKINGQTVQISGFHLTGEYNRKFLIGYNFNFVADYMELPHNGAARRLRFNWHSMQLGYEIAAHRRIHPVADLDLGLGRVKVADVGKDPVYVLSPTAGLELNLFRWFHLNFCGGYRWVSGVGIAQLQNADFSGPFGQVTLKFGWSDDFQH